jgi:hypothetical protein
VPAPDAPEIPILIDDDPAVLHLKGRAVTHHHARAASGAQGGVDDNIRRCLKPRRLQGHLGSPVIVWKREEIRTEPSYVKAKKKRDRSSGLESYHPLKKNQHRKKTPSTFWQYPFHSILNGICVISGFRQDSPLHFHVVHLVAGDRDGSISTPRETLPATSMTTRNPVSSDMRGESTYPPARTGRNDGRSSYSSGSELEATWNPVYMARP